MAEFIYSKGYLVNDDLAWDVNEYLVGAEYVNDCVHFYGSGGAHYGAFATNADIVVVRLDTNTQLGWATLTGGFEKICRVGNYLYAVSKLDTTKIYRVQWSTMSGDSTPGGWTEYITAPGSYTFADIHGLTYSSGANEVLAWTGTDGTDVVLNVRVIGGTDYTLTWSGTDMPGFFPNGDGDNVLFYAISTRVLAFVNPHSISADSFPADASVGAIDDDFAGTTIDGRDWYQDVSAGATLAQNDRFEFMCGNSGPARYADAFYLQYCPGDVGVYTKFTMTGDPTPSGAEYTEVAVELTSPDAQTKYRHVRLRTASGIVNRMEVWHGGVLAYSDDSSGYSAHPYIAVDRYLDGSDVKIRISSAASGAGPYPIVWSTIHTYIDAAADLSPVAPGLNSYSDCVVDSTIMAGYFTEFRARDGAAPIYRVRRTSPIYQTGFVAGTDITAAGASFKSLDGSNDVRQIAVSFGAVNGLVQVADLDLGVYDYAQINSSVVSNTIGTAASSAALTILNVMQANRCIAVADDRTSVVIGGSTGAQQIDTTTIGTDNSVDLLRHYTAAYDHAQPLVDVPVWSIDWRGASFVYGTHSEADATNPDYWGYGYGAAGFDDEGGAGWITPDFTAPLGTFAFAQGTLDGEDRVLTSAYQPDPVPTDYLHAHAERRTSGGAWYRLKTTGWVEYVAAGWDHTTDETFLDGSTPTDAYTAIQDTTVSTARYEYRWVYHDEAGNQGELEAVTRYGDFVEYRGTPVISAVSINGGASPVTSRGVTVTIAAHSGTTSGSTAGKVFQVRIWNSDESESDAEWRDFPVADTTGDFYHVLSSGGGTKTIYARARHTSGVTSASVSASTTLNESVTTTVSTDWEAGMIIHGPETTTGRTFTADFRLNAGGAITVSPDASTTYPIDIALQDDVDAQWLSGIGDGGSRFGNETVPSIGYTTYTSIIVFEWSSAQTMGFFALLNHNFVDVLAQPGVVSIGVQLRAGAIYPTFSPAYSVDLSTQVEEGWPFVVHRPNVSHKFWWIKLTMLRANGSYTRSDEPGWKIGRIVLNESAYCWQPLESGVNFDRDWDDEHEDTSEVQDTVSGGRRVVENARLGRVRLRYPFLALEDHTALETIYANHGVRRPIVVVADPINVGTGSTVKYATKPTLIYGYMPDDWSRTNHVNARGSVDFSARGWRG